MKLVLDKAFFFVFFSVALTSQNVEARNNQEYTAKSLEAWWR